MGGLLQTLRHWWQGPEEQAEDAGTLAAREAVRARGRDFRLLIAANSQALRIMAELEEALAGHEPFGMAWLRARAVAVSAAVFQMIHRLGGLAPGRHAGLRERFAAVNREIDALLCPQCVWDETPLVLPLSEVRASHAPNCGGKMAMLGELGAHGLPVPQGFVITAAGYRRFLAAGDLQAEIDRLIQSADVERLDALMALSSGLQNMILAAPLPEDLSAAILSAYDGLAARLSGPPQLAVRSSALGEDAAGASFAGQYHSELNVGREGLLDSYRSVVASKYGVAAMAYRQSKGLRDEDVAMCVGCLCMVPAAAGGVVYTQSPVDPDDDALVVTATPGLPKAIVDGGVTPDVFTVARGGEADGLSIRSREIAHKQVRLDSREGEGLERRELSDAEAGLPALDDAAVLELAAMCLRVEDMFAEAQDIEWARDAAGRFYLLQTRALPRQAPRPQAAAALRPEGVPVLAEGGVTASGGAAAGPVHVVAKEADFLTFPRGGVLVVETSSPRLAALLSRASAVVAGHGSAAGHLASVAREFGVPALFGVADAPRVLAGAGTVTVDADGRAVYAGSVESLLGAGRDPAAPPPDSPVRRVLEAVAGLVVPLSLLDPDSPEFAPENCRTLHDMTRYCHEMAVREMFESGDQAAAAAGTGKRLAVGRATKYWVVDLGGGFLREIPGTSAPLADIACAPMLAVWAGMTAIPWQGPPAPDAKGFLALVAQSAANRDIEPGLDSAFAQRDYFLIDRDSCTLQARFGYHFCTVDSHAGGRPEENYAAFQFKGGAADMRRRTVRAELVGRILARRGFITEVRGDALFARIENRPREELLRLLMVLGHLLVHTRQIDMVMGEARTAAAWEEKLDRDCDAVAARELPRPQRRTRGADTAANDKD